MGKRASLLLRVVSKSVDLIIVFATAEVLHKTGWLAGFGYMLISDGLFEGKSVGKKLTGLRVETESGSPCSIRDSIMRNSTLGLGLLLWKVPFIGWLFLIAVFTFEFIMLLGSEDTRRLGDEIAGTMVIETENAKQET
jgi:uncharacterized RDD family membrane protein YckC